MVYRLGLACGRLNIEGPGGLLETLTDEQLRGWVEYDEYEPIGGIRSDLQTAILAETIHYQLERVIQTHTVKYRPKRKKLKEFLVTELLHPSTPARQPLTADRFRLMKEALKQGRTPKG